MAKIHTVPKSRKEHKCGRCGTLIEKGSSYRHTTIKTGQRSSRKMVRCMDPKCSFRPSEMTVSRRGEAYAAQEGLTDDLQSWEASALKAIEEAGEGLTADDLQAIYDEAKSSLGIAVEAIDAVMEGYRESAENIENGFGHETYQSQELNETADALESWKDSVEQALENAGVDDPSQVLEDGTDPVDWVESIREAIDSAAAECPV